MWCVYERVLSVRGKLASVLFQFSHLIFCFCVLTMVLELVVVLSRLSGCGWRDDLIGVVLWVLNIGFNDQNLNKVGFK